MASVQARPATAGTDSHHSRHLLPLPTMVNTTASMNVSCANSKWARTTSMAKAAKASPRRGSCVGTRWRARRGIDSAPGITSAGISTLGCQECTLRVETLARIGTEARRVAHLDYDAELVGLQDDNGQADRRARVMVVKPDSHRDGRLAGKQHQAPRGGRVRRGAVRGPRPRGHRVGAPQHRGGGGGD